MLKVALAAAIAAVLTLPAPAQVAEPQTQPGVKLDLTNFSGFVEVDPKAMKIRVGDKYEDGHKAVGLSFKHLVDALKKGQKNIAKDLGVKVDRVED